MYHREMYHILLERIREPRRFIQVLAGPRQTGKTTIVHQLIDEHRVPIHYASADAPTIENKAWIEQQWEIGRMKAKENEDQNTSVLVLDEIQKVPNWSEIVKKLWDSDTRNKIPLIVVILGSSPLLVKQGMSESLAGRFETIPITHWSYTEMKKAFGWNLDQFIYFGGYPGAAPLIDDQQRWSRYIIDSLIETSISRDILLMTRVDKPALLRQLFQLGCTFSGQILSYQKMTGQLQDAGNTTTLAHYLRLLSGAGMLTGLHKFTVQKIRQRSSSPKLQVMNTAIISAQSQLSFNEAKKDQPYWGRLVESAIGAHLINSSRGTDIDILYWRERSKEVDFVLRAGEKVVGIEVKSGAQKQGLPGMDAFNKSFTPNKLLLVGGDGMPLEEFLKISASELMTS